MQTGASMSEVKRWHFNSFDLGCHFDSGNEFQAMQPTIIAMVKASDYDALAARCAERQSVILQLEAQVKSLQRELLLLEACHHPGYVIGDHWLAWAYRRICMGEGEEAVMQDYGYTYTDPRPAARKALDALAELDQELLGQPPTPDGR